MKIFYTETEGGSWKPFEINAFAIGLPDGTIWDPIVGIDKMFSFTIDKDGNPIIKYKKEVSK